MWHYLDVDRNPQGPFTVEYLQGKESTHHLLSADAIFVSATVVVTVRASSYVDLRLTDICMAILSFLFM